MSTRNSRTNTVEVAQNPTINANEEVSDQWLEAECKRLCPAISVTAREEDPRVPRE